MSFTAVAMVWDLRTRTLPNWLTVPVGLLAFLTHPAMGAFGVHPFLQTQSWLAGLGFAAAGFGVGFGILFILWLIGGGGGGDVKLMGSLGAWIGPIPTLIVFLASAILAVISTISLRLYRLASGQKVSTQKDKKDAISGKGPHRQIPYAVPVAVATWMFMIGKLIAAGFAN